MRLTLVSPGAVYCSLAVTNSELLMQLQKPTKSSCFPTVPMVRLTLVLPITVQCDVPRVPIVSLTLVSPGAVYCSLAVTNSELLMQLQKPTKSSCFLERIRVPFDCKQKISTKL